MEAQKRRTRWKTLLAFAGLSILCGDPHFLPFASARFDGTALPS
jgi:hypothetical protein